MATGRHPFAVEAPFATMQRILNLDPDPPGSLRALPPGWNELILQLLSKNPAARPPGAAEVEALFSDDGHERERFAASVVSPAPARATPMVGRGPDLVALRRRWEEALARRGHFVMLAAEPGTGKTTLVQNFVQELAGDPDVMVATGRCSERLGTGEPYLPFLEALAELCGSAHGALVRAIVKSKAPTWYVQLFPATSGDSSWEQMRREMAGGSQERMRRELADAFEEIVRGYPLCLALEDLHWSDLATTELFAYLSKRIGALRLLVLGSYRPSELLASAHPLRPILLEMQGRGAAVEMALGLLDGEAVQTYIGQEFAGHRFPREFASWVFRKTEGNPLFMTDLLRYLVERGAIVSSPEPGPRAWQLTRPIADLEGEVPQSVRSMIERKVETLSEEQRTILSAAAVQGEMFDSVVLSDLTGVEELRLEEQLETLQRVHRLVAPLQEIELPDGSAAVRHKFVHVLYQNTLYQGLTARRKALLHAKAGEALARRHGPRAHAAAAELALHFDRARLFDRALPHYLEAAGNAVSKFAHVQAEAYCTRALELAEKLPAEARDRARMPALNARGQVRFVMSRFEDASADYQEMHDCARRLVDHEAEAEALCHLSEASFWSKHNDRLEEQVARVLAIAEEHHLPGAAAQGHFLLGMQRSCYGRLAEADPHIELAEERAREAKTGIVLARTVAWKSMLWYYRGDYERVLANARRVESLGLEHHDAFSILVSLFNTGLSHANAGHLSEAQRVLENGRRMSERNNDLFWLGRYPNCVAWLHHEGFEFPRALDLNTEAAVIARQTGFLEGEANSIINVGLARTELGDYAAAREAFEKTEEVFKQDDWFKWRYRLRLEMGWSELCYRQDDLPGARRHAETVRRGAQSSGARKHLALALRQLGRIALRQEQVAEAEGHLKGAVETTADLQAPLAAWRAHASLGDLYRATHRADRARTAYGTALQLLRDLAENAPGTLRVSILESRQVRGLEQELTRA
jgi:tetratricopeptide (TPR) repeat protein